MPLRRAEQPTSASGRSDLFAPFARKCGSPSVTSSSAPRLGWALRAAVLLLVLVSLSGCSGPSYIDGVTVRNDTDVTQTIRVEILQGPDHHVDRTEILEPGKSIHMGTLLYRELPYTIYASSGDVTFSDRLNVSGFVGDVHFTAIFLVQDAKGFHLEYQ